jgi:hemoglobin
MAQSLFEQVGGEFGLRLIINDFVGRVFADTMIGYLFRKADIQRVREMEYQFAASHMGGSVVYQGRPLTAAHHAHHILDGHFARRLQILKDVLATHGCPNDVVTHWVTHTEGLKSKILSADAKCNE